ncbi:MAG: hypothetical protein KatS3mg129_2639 [Leptospiraceae bacterium]|nr:MAG: hypothetical protein KatS3mg129_2639 [Leptospiraceae bacterium]
MVWLIRKNIKRNWGLILLIISLLFNCSKKEEKLLFEDDLEEKTGLFNILDPYPSLKSYFSSMEPGPFNEKMNTSMNYYPEVVVDSMRSLANLTLNKGNTLRALLMEISSALQKINTMDSDKYSTITSLIDRIRLKPESFIETTSPLDHNTLQKIYERNSNVDLIEKQNKIISKLEDKDIQNLIKDLDSIIHKGLVKNSNIKNASTQLLYYTLIPDLHYDKAFKKHFINLLNDLGNLASLKITNKLNQQEKTLPVIIKELTKNIESHFTENNPGESNNVFLQILIIQIQTLMVKILV